MKILCQCGNTIYDQTDYESYKARFVADQDYYDLSDAVEQAIRALAATIERATVDNTAAPSAVQEAIGSAHDAISKYTRRTMYQCSECGRLFVDDGQFTAHIFVPNDATVPKTLLRSHEGESWKRPLRGLWNNWQDRPDKGELWWGFGVDDEGYERYDDFDALKQRYFEVFARLRERNILRDAFLRIGTDMLHQWP